jgi:hypothetical protein
MANIPILYNYFKQKTVVGCLDLIFSLSGVTPLKPILAAFEAIILANTMQYAKRF